MHDVQSDDFIIFSDVAKTFQVGSQPYTAVRDVTMSIKRGEIVMLLGPSGCGKSTLLNLTAGLIGPSEGQVIYDGALIAGLNSKVAYMTQQDHLLPWRTVAGNISLRLKSRDFLEASAKLGWTSC
jgi:NitT/TauT family transport system ATP-binding protein